MHFCNCCNQYVEFVPAGQVGKDIKFVDCKKRKADGDKDINPTPKKLSRLHYHH